MTIGSGRPAVPRGWTARDVRRRLVTQDHRPIHVSQLVEGTSLTGSRLGLELGQVWRLRHTVEISRRHNARTWHPGLRSFKTATSTRTARLWQSTWTPGGMARSLKSAQVRKWCAGSF